jgi:hypothetical protein
MKLPSERISIYSLVAVNLLPVAGVFGFGWDVGTILLLYWAENLVVGFYNILKMALVKMDRPGQNLGKLFKIPFFSIHFGAFCAVHGFFLLIFFDLAPGGSLFGEQNWPGPLVFVELLIGVVGTVWENAAAAFRWSVYALFLSHGVSFIHNYILTGEYTSLSLSKLMSRPYSRIVLLHVTIIAGGVPVLLLGSPDSLLLVLVGLKIGVDIWLHVRSHRLD